MNLSIDILKKELIEYEKALKRSTECYNHGKIKLSLHNKHRKNLFPKIMNIKYSIKILENDTIKSIDNLLN